MRLARKPAGQLVLSMSICTNEYVSIYVHMWIICMYNIINMTYFHSLHMATLNTQISFFPSQFTVPIGVAVSSFGKYFLDQLCLYCSLITL